MDLVYPAEYRDYRDHQFFLLSILVGMGTGNSDWNLVCPLEKKGVGRAGVPVEQLFWNLGQRSGVEEIRNFGDIFLIARRSGGNLGKILGNLAEVLGEKIRVTGEIQVAIAGKKLEQLVMSMVPGVMILYMQVTSRGFLDVLYHNLPGVLVMTGCLGVYLFSFRMGRKIVRIQV